MNAMTISPEINRLINEIKNDRAHGASELARQAVTVLKITAECSRAETIAQFLWEQKTVGERLMSARPAMAPLFNIVMRLLNIITTRTRGLDLDSARRFTLATADNIIQDSLLAVARIARLAADLIADNDRIMTHSYSSTVVAVLKEAAAKHQNIEVTITRSGAGRSGERTARELESCRMPLTFIDDTAVGLYITTMNKVLVGADRICADGKVINGIGTYPLALAAERARIPLYVSCETLKFDPRTNSSQVDLEEKDTEEVVAPGVLPPVVKVKNLCFDITPLELVTGVVTERGVMSAAEVTGYMAEHTSTG